MPARAAIAAAILLSLPTAACETHDVGSDCPQMEIPFDSGGTFDGDLRRAQGPEVVEFDVLFPCVDPVCVITLGHAPYCSRECGGPGQCPDGFECRPVMQIGPFEGYEFCVWKECDRASDCGDPWVLGCKEIPELSLQTSTRLCRYRD